MSRALTLFSMHAWLNIQPKYMFGQGSARMDPQTAICIFDGIMKQELFVDILASTLSPSINALYPGGHRLMMDNDPKHISRYAAAAWMNSMGSIGGEHQQNLRISIL